MPRSPQKIPSYRLHKATGQAVVTLSGADIYLGIHGTDASHHQYDGVIVQWLSDHKLRPTSSSTGGRSHITMIDVHQLFNAYHDFAATYYVKNGKCTGVFQPHPQEPLTWHRAIPGQHTGRSSNAWRMVMPVRLPY